MTTLKDPIPVSLEPRTEPQPTAQAADWQGLYDAVLTQLMANVETMVAHAFASHAKDHGVPIAPAPAPGAEPSDAAPAATGNAGLDYINAQLHRHAPNILPPSAMPTPPWLQPFTLPEKVRFTRTPDPVMRWERAMPTPEELAIRAREAARMAAEDAARIAQAKLDQVRAETGDVTPIWRKPFSLPPNVRYTRTPDVKVARSTPPATEDSPGQALVAVPDPTVQTATEVQEAVTTSESPDGGFRSVTFTKTVTTVESVAVTTVEPTEREMAMPGAVAAEPEAAPQIEHETSAGTAQEPEAQRLSESPAPVEPHTVASRLTAEAWSDLGLPAWFHIIRQSATTPQPIAVEQDNTTLAAAGGDAAIPDADADSSAALARHAFWQDGDEAAPSGPTETIATTVHAHGTPEPLGDDADSEGSGALWRTGFLGTDEPTIAAPAIVVASSIAPIVLSADKADPKTATPSRVAFGSHGIPAFAQAVHFEGDPNLYDPPAIDFLAPAREHVDLGLTRDVLEQNARLLEGVLEDFGVRGEIIAVRPGPVVTLYELEPAPGVKSSRVVGLSDDIARSMSAVSARVAVVQGRNVIGIELPNERRETVFLRELVGLEEFDESEQRLAIALGKTIGGEPVIVDLARMPHLLVAGTTGSGKSVAINTMILSLLYRMKPDACRLIMVDPKMLELSIYDGIPHLLTPVVTDPKKAVIALKWAVREMEDRYKKMSKVGVRNIDGFNARLAEARAKGEVITRTVQQGFDRETGDPVFETEAMDLAPLPYIVIIVDEMADLMMVAGKEIEGAIQRLAQMARAAGIHLIMATQRPSVDVITGTIKANFPTRISFQVTSKIDSRTILGEQGAEQLLGQGDMLYMAGGGRIARVHGPFVSDGEVERVVMHLKAQGRPDYLDVVTAEEDEAGAPEDEIATDGAVFDKGNFSGDDVDLYDQAVKVVLRDKKCSTSYIQRRLQVGYNKAASLVERMEKEGLVGPANHAGKREILNYSRDHQRMIVMPGGGE